MLVGFTLLGSCLLLSSGDAPRCASPVLKKKASPFEPYEIRGQGSDIFPLPSERSAVRVAKKLMPKGCAPSKLPADALASWLPEIDLNYPGLRVLHLDPPVLTVDNFFSPEECDEFHALHASPADEGAAHELAQSATFGGSTTRTSTTWFIAYQRATALLARSSALLGVDDIRRFEEPQLVRYRPGQQFAWHYDAVPVVRLPNGGQRLTTLLVYLNDVPAGSGGRTAFRDLHAGGMDADGAPTRLGVAPKKGRALIFCPADAEGSPDDRTLHAGEPGGHDKWIAQLWLHQAPYTPTVPEGSSHEAAEVAVRSYSIDRSS